jgi:hypothetical protein
VEAQPRFHFTVRQALVATALAAVWCAGWAFCLKPVDRPSDHPLWVYAFWWPGLSWAIGGAAVGCLWGRTSAGVKLGLMIGLLLTLLLSAFDLI